MESTRRSHKHLTSYRCIHNLKGEDPPRFFEYWILNSEHHQPYLTCLVELAKQISVLVITELLCPRLQLQTPPRRGPDKHQHCYSYVSAVSQSTQSNLEDLQQDGGQRTYSDIPIINSVICIARVRAISNSVMLLYIILSDF